MIKVEHVKFEFSEVDAIAPRYACVQGLGRGAPAYMAGSKDDFPISCCFFPHPKSMEPQKNRPQDAFQYLVETVRKAEESGETEQARFLGIFRGERPRF